MYGTLWGIILLKCRHLVCLSMIAILPVSLTAQESAAAMSRSNGTGVLVNKKSPPSSVALFSDDLIETQGAGVARIEAGGSTADISPETIVQFEGDELVLEHGSLSLNTARGLRVRVGCLIVTPANIAEWTRYDVADVDGKVTVSALKSDVNIDVRTNKLQQAKQSAPSSRISVREGERKSREEKCAATGNRTPASTAGSGAIMSSPWAISAGVAGIGILACAALCRGSSPISPAHP